MNKKGLLAGLCLVFIFCAFLVITHLNNDNNLKSYYESRIDKRIKGCEKKALLWESKLRNINCCAIISMIKATYFRKNKRKLIKAMYDKNIGTKQYKVDYFLNQSFYEAFKSSAVKSYMIDVSEESETIIL